MKLIGIILSIIAIFSSKVTIAQNTIELSGKWTVDFEKTVQTMNSDAKKRYEDMRSANKDELKKSFQGRIFHFLKDNNVAIKFNVRGILKQVNGMWSYIPSTRKLTISSEDKSANYEVEWLTKDQIQLKFLNAPAQGLFQSLILERNN